MAKRQLVCGVLALATVAMLAAVPAHAIIVYEEPGRLTTMPVLYGSHLSPARAPSRCTD
jgi:hypothetical protein